MSGFHPARKEVKTAFGIGYSDHHALFLSFLHLRLQLLSTKNEKCSISGYCAISNQGSASLPTARIFFHSRLRNIISYVSMIGAVVASFSALTLSGGA
jgi:hypothetical protein